MPCSDGVDGIEGRSGIGTFSSGMSPEPWQSPVQVQFQTVVELAAATGGAGDPPQLQFQFITSVGSEAGAWSVVGLLTCGGLAGAWVSVPGLGASPPPPTTKFCCTAGPSLPGLRIRIEMLLLVCVGGGSGGAAAGGSAGAAAGAGGT
jgi:hypothetical protein